MEEKRKSLKVYHGIITLILAAACVFFVSPILGFKLGIYGIVERQYFHRTRSSVDCCCAR